MNIKEKLKHIIYDDLYYDFFPLSDADNKEEILDIINCCDLDTYTYESHLVHKIYRYALSDISEKDLLLGEIERSDKFCMRTKKLKKKDENGNKYKEKVQTLKKGYKSVKDKNKKKRSKIENNKDAVCGLIKNLENRCVTEDNLPIIDGVILNHKMNTKFEYVTVSIVLGAFVVMIALKYLLF
jgi:hypothetical protein